MLYLWEKKNSCYPITQEYRGSHGCGWIYNYICNQCLSLLIRCQLEPHSWWDVLDTTLCDKVCQCLATSLCNPVASTNKADRHDITVILLKVALNTINQTTRIWKYIYAFPFSKSGKRLTWYNIFSSNSPFCPVSGISLNEADEVKGDNPLTKLWRCCISL